MPIQHRYRPQHLAMAVALAIGCVEFANAQQPPEAAEIPVLVSEQELPEVGAREAALQRIRQFATDTGTVPTALNSLDKPFQGTAANDLILLKDGASFNGKLDGGEGTNFLVLDASEGGTLKDTANFNGAHVVQGDWTLKSKGDFTQGVLVERDAALANLGNIEGGVISLGKLFNKGVIKGNVHIEQGGSYAGKGAVANLRVDGLLTVDGSQGSPKVKGNLSLSPGAELAYEVNPTGKGETIKVDGVADLDGATLRVVAAAGNYPASSQYKILEAAEVKGKFGTVVNDLAFMTATPQYNKKSVGLLYARNDLPLTSAATSDNAQAIAASIIEPQAPSPSAVPTPAPIPAPAALTASSVQASDPESGVIPVPPAAPPPVAPVNDVVDTQAPTPKPPANTAVAAILASDLKTASVALDQLAAGSNANLAKATLNSISPVSTGMLSAMRQLNHRSGAADGAGNAPRQATGGAESGRVWVQALGHGGKVDRDSNNTLKHATQGLLVGADWRLDEQWHIGLLGGKSQTKLDAGQYDGDLDSWHLGAYAVRQDGPLALRLGATYANHDGSSKRRVAFKGFSDRLKGGYDANTQQAFAELGFNLGRGNVTLEPFASLGYQRYHRDSYHEKGGDAALKLHGQTRDNLSSTFGLRVAQVNTLDNGMHLTPRFSAGWRHTYGEVDSDTRQQLLKGGKRFEVDGAALDRNSLSVVAGLDFGLSVAHTLGVGLTGEMGNDSRTYGVAGQWRMAF
ncbi:autotransporter domain-containing protein [Pseudomonas sp. SWRI153]|uniref:Autotransporter domain-containing protein n=1 Tax=Pseudomonas khorasanensis TaxID=2745508 RepID=A0A923JEL9_9PSED|nr:autotransporter outer membrane beta-barrel domain-containing protein [Pseudomonas khorasanensis]MBV4486046.1 autotransporter domain-containing protein [Pseudomonas khorasanensis]